MEISTYGHQLMTVDFGLRHKFIWDFITANVKQPILGANFLRHFNLLVDLKRRKLLDDTTQLSTPAKMTRVPAPALSTINTNSEYHDPLREFITSRAPLKKVNTKYSTL